MQGAFAGLERRNCAGCTWVDGALCSAVARRTCSFTRSAKRCAT